MFFPKEHRKRCEKAHFARFYTAFAFSTCQLHKKKEHIGSKGTNYWSKPHTLLTRQAKKGKKALKTLVLPGQIQLPFRLLTVEQ